MKGAQVAGEGVEDRPHRVDQLVLLAGTGQCLQTTPGRLLDSPEMALWRVDIFFFSPFRHTVSPTMIGPIHPEPRRIEGLFLAHLLCAAKRLPVCKPLFQALGRKEASRPEAGEGGLGRRQRMECPPAGVDRVETVVAEALWRGRECGGEKVLLRLGLGERGEGGGEGEEEMVHEPEGERPEEEGGERAGGEVGADVAGEGAADFAGGGAGGRVRGVEEALEAGRRRRAAAVRGGCRVEARRAGAERGGVRVVRLGWRAQRGQRGRRHVRTGVGSGVETSRAARRCKRGWTQVVWAVV